MLYSITMGDWSTDGHGVTHTFIIDLKCEETSKQLGENYDANVLKYGINPAKICEGYEEYTIDPDVAARIDQHVKFHDGESVIEEYDGRFSFRDGYEGLFRVIMFLTTDGLTCSWNEHHIESLAGPGPVGGSDNFGYGLLGP